MRPEFGAIQTKKKTQKLHVTTFFISSNVLFIINKLQCEQYPMPFLYMFTIEYQLKTIIQLTL